MQQGRIIVTTLLQTWILLSATRSYHGYDLVADMNFAQCNKVVSWLRPCCRHEFCSVQQGRIMVTNLLQTWILLSATRSYHRYDLVADMNFAQCSKVVSFYKVPGWTCKIYGRRYDVVTLRMQIYALLHIWPCCIFFQDTTLLHWCDEMSVNTLWESRHMCKKNQDCLNSSKHGFYIFGKKTFIFNIIWLTVLKW